MAAEQLDENASIDFTNSIKQFAHDLVSYILVQYDLARQHISFHCSQHELKISFVSNVGKAVMYDMLIARRQLRRLFDGMMPNGVWEPDVRSFLLDRMFPGSPFEEFFVLSLVASYACVHCSRFGHAEAVDDIIEFMSYAFHRSIKKHFMELGGWPSFCRFVDELNKTRKIPEAA